MRITAQIARPGLRAAIVLLEPVRIGAKRPRASMVHATAAHRIVQSPMAIQGEQQGCASRPLSWTSLPLSLDLQLSVSKATQGLLARLLRTVQHGVVQQSAPTTYAHAEWGLVAQLMEDACTSPMGLVVLSQLVLVQQLLPLQQRRPQQRPRPPPRQQPQVLPPPLRLQIGLDWRLCPRLLQPQGPELQKAPSLGSVLQSRVNVKSTRSASIKPQGRKRRALVPQAPPSTSTSSAVIHLQAWQVVKTTSQTAPRVPQVQHAN